MKNPFKKANKIRLMWGLIYLVLGILLFISKYIPWKDFFCNYGEKIYWILPWALVGIGYSLLNSRDNGNKNNEYKKYTERYRTHTHYILYYGSSLVYILLASYALSLFPTGEYNKTFAAFIALSLGFCSERIDKLISIKI